MPESAATSPFQSKRNSRYTSGESSVSEPVIPDVSLIMEAELSKSKTERVRRRLVPFQTSSEEGGGHYASDSDLSELTSSDNEDEGEQDGRDGNFYRRPYRTRDGYGSGYASDVHGGQSRPVSRPASRSPSRGILKRSSSACSQRSNKSVRIEIPKDRKALEEVREAEDKVDSAKRRLQDLRKRKGARFTVSDADVLKAAEAVDEAERSLKDKEDAYRVILESMKRSQPEQEMGPRYV
ncbi:hypothetical protein DFH11DRAFT_1722023 [Phellopilus nigrolimitatus]|nr:hypothetical protein DFH11DRAFT_1722023 [Phellopilus nigrolimitatus]